MKIRKTKIHNRFDCIHHINTTILHVPMYYRYRHGTIKYITKQR